MADNRKNLTANTKLTVKPGTVTTLTNTANSPAIVLDAEAAEALADEPQNSAAFAPYMLFPGQHKPFEAGQYTVTFLYPFGNNLNVSTEKQ